MQRASAGGIAPDPLGGAGTILSAYRRPSQSDEAANTAPKPPRPSMLGAENSLRMRGGGVSLSGLQSPKSSVCSRLLLAVLSGRRETPGRFWYLAAPVRHALYSALFFSASSSTIDSSCGGLWAPAAPAVAMLAPRTLAARAKMAPLVRSDARMLARLFVARAASASVCCRRV